MFLPVHFRFILTICITKLIAVLISCGVRVPSSGSDNNYLYFQFGLPIKIFLLDVAHHFLAIQVEFERKVFGWKSKLIFWNTLWAKDVETSDCLC